MLDQIASLRWGRLHLYSKYSPQNTRFLTHSYQKAFFFKVCFGTRSDEQEGNGVYGRYQYRGKPKDRNWCIVYDAYSEGGD